MGGGAAIKKKEPFWSFKKKSPKKCKSLVAGPLKKELFNGFPKCLFTLIFLLIIQRPFQSVEEKPLTLSLFCQVVLSKNMISSLR